jgi:hypothetical protein
VTTQPAKQRRAQDESGRWLEAMPPTVTASLRDCPKLEERLPAALEPELMEKLGKIASYLRAAQGKKDPKKRKQRKPKASFEELLQRNVVMVGTAIQERPWSADTAMAAVLARAAKLFSTTIQPPYSLLNTV